MKRSKRKSSKSEPKTHSTDEVKRYLGVLQEQSRHDMQAIGEQYFDLRDKLKSNTEMIGKMAVDIEIIKEDIAFIKGDLKKKVDLDEFRTLERRVALLEKRR
ncbi:MAG: hypothetical protein HYT48_00845 [Candidatus Vogelbacteria bacterium]|nr:hypothetical protein [Candidatus Vogelbacteria bacterium]